MPSRNKEQRAQHATPRACSGVGEGGEAADGAGGGVAQHSSRAVTPPSAPPRTPGAVLRAAATAAVAHAAAATAAVAHAAAARAGVASDASAQPGLGVELSAPGSELLGTLRGVRSHAPRVSRQAQ
jgi:hypothetical protein